MAATITSTAQRITISGNYKAFTAGSGNTTTVIQYSTGDAPATGDAGRFLMWKNGSNTSNWEIRFIESATASTVTVTDGGFSSAPSSGNDFVISTTLADIDAATAGSVMRSQGSSYQMRGRDFELTAGAFVADVNASLVTESTQTGSGFIGTYPVANNCALQFGRLIGGEANDSTETIGGCQVTFEVANDTLMFTTQNAANTAGPILNFYGCLVESYANGNSPFIRGPGPVRLIGSICDGPMGGRLYNSGSELVSTRFSGNTSGGIAWSLGGVFTRPIDDAFFFQGNTAVKAFGAFNGAFTNVTFADSLTNIIDAASAQPGLTFTFVDCTTFENGDISANKGNYTQAKSINYTVADSNGTGLSGVKVVVCDVNGDIQTGIQTSSSGTVAQINAVFFDKAHGSAAVTKSPFDIRLRKYGYQYQAFQSAVSEPIKQEYRLPTNPKVSASEAAAGAISGISLNFVTETLTITSNTTFQELYDYYQYQLAQDANMKYAEDFVLTGEAFDLGSWDMVIDGCEYTGDITTTGTITLQNSATATGSLIDSTGTSVVIEVNCKDSTDASNVPGARVYVEATSGGALAAGTQIVNAVTDSNGDIAERVTITPTQPATLRVRKGTSAPYYRTSESSINIGATGIDVNVSLIRDQ